MLASEAERGRAPRSTGSERTRQARSAVRSRVRCGARSMAASIRGICRKAGWLSTHHFDLARGTVPLEFKPFRQSQYRLDANHRTVFGDVLDGAPDDLPRGQNNTRTNRASLTNPTATLDAPATLDASVSSWFALAEHVADHPFSSTQRLTDRLLSRSSRRILARPIRIRGFRSLPLAFTGGESPRPCLLFNLQRST